jgi:hypothetical protein
MTFIKTIEGAIGQGGNKNDLKRKVSFEPKTRLGWGSKMGQSGI